MNIKINNIKQKEVSQEDKNKRILKYIFGSIAVVVLLITVYKTVSINTTKTKEIIGITNEFETKNMLVNPNNSKGSSPIQIKEEEFQKNQEDN
jgi:hypothetical protein